MCQFFSFCSDGMGKTFYFNWEMRHEGLKTKKYEPDSHASIAHYFNLIENKLNKYEYNPFTKKFNVDRLNNTDDSTIVERWVKNLNFKKVIEPLVIKEIINPLKIKPKKVTDSDKNLLKEWASVWASVRASVGASVWASVGAYASSFFLVDYKHDFSSSVKLWKRGFVPSFDGKAWRLHSGPKAGIVYEYTEKGDCAV